MPRERFEQIQEIVTDQKDIYIHLVERYFEIPCRLYEDDKISLDKVYALPSKIKELLAPKAYMKSGAYLVIEPTEALVVIACKIAVLLPMQAAIGNKGDTKLFKKKMQN